MINLSTATESSTTDASIGPPPVTSYCIIIVKWPSEKLMCTSENLLGIAISC